MANSDRAIARISFLHHQGSHRLAHDITASQHYAMFAASRDLVTSQQFQNTGRSRRHEPREADRHTADVDRMETVHILTVVDRFDDLLFRDMFRKRKLHDEAVHIRIVVQFVHLVKKLFFRNIGFITDQRRFETNLITCLHFTGDQYGSQMRNLATGSLDAGHFFRHLLLHLS